MSLLVHGLAKYGLRGRLSNVVYMTPWMTRSWWTRECSDVNRCLHISLVQIVLFVYTDLVCQNVNCLHRWSSYMYGRTKRMANIYVWQFALDQFCGMCWNSVFSALKRIYSGITGSCLMLHVGSGGIIGNIGTVVSGVRSLLVHPILSISLSFYLCCNELSVRQANLLLSWHKVTIDWVCPI